MRVTRIVANLRVTDTARATRFYADALGLEISDDFGWIGFLTSDRQSSVEMHTENWGVRRFFFADPDGNVINVVGHRS